MGLIREELELNARIITALLDDVATLFSIPPLDLDVAYIRMRLEHEGTSFLTKSLPEIGKALDEWMKDETKPLSFGKSFRPTFLSRLRTLILDAESDHDRAAAIRCVRQLAYLYYKLEQPLSNEGLLTAVQSFEEVEHELAVLEIPWYSEEFHRARQLVNDLIDRCSFDRFIEAVKPKHGPGAVATGEKGIKKWAFKRFFPLTGSVLDFREMYHLPPFATICADEARSMYSNLVIDPLPTSKLVAVPKDSRGPRLICEEPLEMQYLQQWLFCVLDNLIEESRYVDEISMHSQLRNQILAAEGSYTSSWATIDLKDASDRVSLPLVLSLFPDWMHPWLRAFRSQAVLLPTGKTIRTHKYAPMGSAICFPIETIVFWSLSRAVVDLKGLCNRLPCPSVSVFGDDIIVPNNAADAVCSMLSACGLKVNMRKTFSSGCFRESCGFDAYNGFEVTPVRIKKAFPSSWRDVGGISNYVAVSNGLHKRGFIESAKLITKELLKIAPLLSSDNSGGLALSNSPWSGKRRMNRSLQREEVFTYKVKPLEMSLPEDHLRLRRSVISPVVEGDPTIFSPPRLTRMEKGWVARLSASRKG